MTGSEEEELISTVVSEPLHSGWGREERAGWGPGSPWVPLTLKEPSQAPPW